MRRDRIADPVTEWLIDRMNCRLSPCHHDHARCWGISSDALAAYGASGIRRPQVPGHPVEPGRPFWRGDECGTDFPSDVGDLNACERTYEQAPDVAEVRDRMRPVLLEFRRWVIEGVNRHGDRVTVRPRGWGEGHLPADLEVAS